MQVAAFTQDMLLEVALQIKENGTSFAPMIHFLPGDALDVGFTPPRSLYALYLLGFASCYFLTQPRGQIWIAGQGGGWEGKSPHTGGKSPHTVGFSQPSLPLAP